MWFARCAQRVRFQALLGVRDFGGAVRAVEVRDLAGVGQAEHSRLSAAEGAERERIAAVARYDILDTPPDGAFDRIAALAARLLDMPYATISIVDADRIWLKATHGLTGVRQLGRDPGLCSSAIAQAGPYLVADALADPQAASNSLVVGALGIRFYAAAPITTSDGYRLGTLNVLDTRPRTVSEADLANLQDLAAVVMDQLELRLSALATLRQERRARALLEEFAAGLQQSLLPPSLPAVPGLELACHYHAASARNVTGDFYDVFSVGEDRWAFFLGDVQGHGTQAAAVTSLTRYTLRAAALHNPDDPAACLDELNAALLLADHTQRFCTVLLGILQPETDGGFRVILAGGGHPPALWLRPAVDGPGKRVERVKPAHGMLVGAIPDAAFTTTILRLSPGETLLLYTDGLIEARPGGELYGETRLADFLAEQTDATAADLVDALVKLIDGFQPAPTDDVALLALGVPRST